MRIAAVSTVRNEADIIAATVRHLLAEGVDDIYIADGMSTDGTRDILETLPVHVVDDSDEYHHQPYWVSRLAHTAYENRAEFVICFDADEFWYAPSGRSIADELADLDPSVTKLLAPMWQHIDYRWREPHAKPLCKVAFRAQPHPRVANGNHNADIAGGVRSDVLALREIQFRDFDHFCRKITERCATLDPTLPPGEGTHITQYRGWDRDQLRPEWEALIARATVDDPIPSRR